MNMIWSISWKNVWRNRVRSIIVIAAFTVGLFGAVFAVAAFTGMAERRVKTALGSEVFHIQAYKPGYTLNDETEYVLNYPEETQRKLEALPGITGSSPVIRITGMAATPGASAGIIISGIEPDGYLKVSSLNQQLQAGDFPEAGERQILLGKKLAKTLKMVNYQISDTLLQLLEEAGLDEEAATGLASMRDQLYRTERDFEEAVEEHLQQKPGRKLLYELKEGALQYKLRRRVSLTFQHTDGSLTGGVFRLAGVYRTSNSGFDAAHVFVPQSLLRNIVGLQEGEAHMIAVMTEDAATVETVQTQLQTVFPDWDIQNWKTLKPDLEMMAGMMNQFMIIFVVIILFALGFGIVNTMLMVVLERTKELGMLMAVGMNRRRIFRMIMLETLSLAITGAVLGLAVTQVVVSLTARKGIDLSHLFGQGFEAMGISAVVYPHLSGGNILQVILLVILTGILASVYPARKALRLNPADALRME